jgi:hypothetical protein
MTHRNKVFAALQSSYIVFALIMASLNCNWAAIKFNWLGWVWLASIIPAIIDLVLIFRSRIKTKQPCDEILIEGGICQLTTCGEITCDEAAADIEEVSKEPVQL